MYPVADTRGGEGGRGGAIAPPIFLGEAFILKNVEAQENFRLKDVEALLLTILIPQNKRYEVSFR